MSAKYDVVIIGAGVSGMTLAYQLLLSDADTRIALVHDGDFPNEDVTHKIGESMNEVAAIYMSQILGLGSFMKEHHPLKMGMRFFQIDESSYKEMGFNKLPYNESFHFERGRLENNLFDLIKDRISFYGKHKYIDFTEIDGEKHVSILSRNDGVQREITARWLVDAAGLKKILARKFDISRRLPINNSSSWVRLGGGVNVDEFLPRGEGNPFTSEKRSWSSTHLEGRGYWIWLLRLSEDVTSVGLIIDEDIYDFREIDTQEKLMLWLKTHERRFHDYLEEKQFPVIDFRKMRGFASTSDYWVSKDRWAIIGDAYGLWDPYYSNGFDLIAIQNTILTSLIMADRRGEVIENRLKDANKFLHYVMTGMENVFRDFYHRKGRWYYVCVKYLIDTLLNIPVLCAVTHNALQPMFHDEDDAFRKKVFAFMEQGGFLHGRMVNFMKSKEFEENGFSGDDHLLINVDTYHVFNPQKDISYDDRENVYSIFELNIKVLKCVLYYMENGRDFLNFIRRGAYFAITHDTDPERYKDDPDQLERDLFRPA